MKPYLIGLDNGGTVIKAALFDAAGRELCVSSRKTPVESPRPGYVERDMDELWGLNCACLREVTTRTGVAAEDLAGLAVCGHGKGLYLWGRDDRPAFRGIGSTDNRAWRTAEQWAADGTWERLYPKLCQKLTACQQAALLRWMKENQPEIYGNIRWVFSVKDYIRFRLTGEAFCEVTDLSGSGLMDVRSGCTDRSLLEVLGIGEIFDALAPLKRSFDLCGAVTPKAAAQTGLPAGLPVAGGMFDVDACALACGVTRPGAVCTVTGTWSINECLSPHPVTDGSIAMNSRYAVPDFYLLEESSATGAGNLDWVAENVLDTGGRTGSARYDYVTELARSVAPEDTEVYYLPFLYGSNTHALAKAGLIGLTEYHTAAHIARAAMEGIAFSCRTHTEKLFSATSRPERIRMAGGAVKSPFWVQMFADVLGLAVETADGADELGALGCAMAAAVATGVWRDYDEAAEHMVHLSPPVAPDAARTAIYDRKYETYRAVTAALDTVWSRFPV